MWSQFADWHKVARRANDRLSVKSQLQSMAEQESERKQLTNELQAWFGNGIAEGKVA